MTKRTKLGLGRWVPCGVIVAGIIIVGTLVGIYWFTPLGKPVPTVQILQPAQTLEIESGQAVVLVARGKSNNGVQRIEFLVNGIPVNQQSSGQPKQETLDVVFPWFCSQLGSHNLSVIAYDEAGVASQPESVQVVVKPKNLGGSPQQDILENNNGGPSNEEVQISEESMADPAFQNVDESGESPLEIDDQFDGQLNQPEDVPPVFTIFEIQVARAGNLVNGNYTLAAIDDSGLAYMTLFIANSNDPLIPSNIRIPCGGELSCAANGQIPIPQGAWILSAQAVDISGQASILRSRQVQVLEGEEPHAVAMEDDNITVQLDPQVNWEEVQIIEEEGEDDIGAPSLAEYLCDENYETVSIQVPYFYMSDHGDEVFLGAWAESGNTMVAAGHTPVEHGAGVARFEMEQLIDESIRTEQLELHFMASGGNYFYKELATFPINWPEPKPDLRIADVAFENGQWQIEVHNMGCTAVDGFHVQLRTQDFGLVNEFMDAQISPGRTYTWAASDDPNLLSRGFLIVLDPDNMINEINEDNNSHEVEPVSLMYIHIYKIDIHDVMEDEWYADSTVGEFWFDITVGDQTTRRPIRGDWTIAMGTGPRELDFSVEGVWEPIILSPMLNWDQDLEFSFKISEDDDEPFDLDFTATDVLNYTHSHNILDPNTWKTNGEFSEISIRENFTLWWRLVVDQ
jgi:hypothetical protein